MARPPANAARQSANLPAIKKLPKAPKGMTPRQIAKYERLGKLLVDAGTLAATDLPMLEDLARVDAAIDDLYSDAQSSKATIAAFHRLSKEIKAQLGMSSAARRAVQRLEDPSNPATDRIRGLLE